MGEVTEPALHKNGGFPIREMKLSGAPRRAKIKLPVARRSHTHQSGPEGQVTWLVEWEVTAPQLQSKAHRSEPG